MATNSSPKKDPRDSVIDRKRRERDKKISDARKSVFKDDSKSKKKTARKTLPRGAREEQLRRQRIGDVAADFLERRKEQREKNEKKRQQNQLQKELEQLQQKKFLLQQKVTQLSQSSRRNEMDKMHTSGLTRKYQTDVDRYQKDILKNESMKMEFKKQFRRNPRDQELPKQIKQVEGTIKRLETLKHGVDTKIKLQDEAASAREKRQLGLKRDILMFSDQVEDLEKREHQIKQQIRFLGQ